MKQISQEKCMFQSRNNQTAERENTLSVWLYADWKSIKCFPTTVKFLFFWFLYWDSFMFLLQICEAGGHLF